MKSLYESIISSNNASRQQQAILDYLNSRFCEFDNTYNIYSYDVGKDSKGWYVDVTEARNSHNAYKMRSNTQEHSPFDGWKDFNRYVERYPNNEEGWIKCPEFRYRKIKCNLKLEGLQHLDSLEGIEEIEGIAWLRDCITNIHDRIKVDGLKASQIIILADYWSIRGMDPRKFFQGKLNCKNIEIR